MSVAPPIDLLEIAYQRFNEASREHTGLTLVLSGLKDKEASAVLDAALLDVVIAARDVSTLKELVMLCS